MTTTSAAASNAAVAAAAALTDTVNPGTSPATTTATTSNHRRALSSRRGTESTSVGTSTSFGSFMARNGVAGSERKNPVSQNTTVDGTTATKPISTKNRSRRASEGSHLIKGEGKRSATELKCDRCGKGYKHGSCLTKHMCVCPRALPFPQFHLPFGFPYPVDNKASLLSILCRLFCQVCLFFYRRYTPV